MVKFSTKSRQLTSRATFCALLLPAQALASDFTATSDTSVSNGGFTVDGSDTLTINSGVTIDHTGVGAVAAIETTGGANTATNNGTIIGDGGMNGRGVVFNGTSSIFINNGLLSTSATTISGAHGMASLGFSPNITNNGLITTTGNIAHGIYLDRSSSVVTNDGIIRVTGVESDAVHFKSSTSNYSTSGATISTQSKAINFGGAELSLTITAPAYIQGQIILAGSNDVTINTGRSHSFQWTFDGFPIDSLTINGSVPTVTSGIIVASIDPTLFENAPGGMLEVTDHIYASITDRSQLLLSDGINGVNLSTKLSPVPDDPNIAEPARLNRWAAGFGSVAAHGASGVKLSYNTGQAGIIAGMDWANKPDRFFGIAAGGAAGAFTANATFIKSQRIQTTGGFASIYGARRWGKSVLDYGFTGGMQNHNSQRSINSNLVVGGIDTARANYGSYYLAPRVSLRRTFGIGSGVALTTTGSLGYVAGWVNGYSETATASTATFASRRFGLGSAAAKIALSKTMGTTTFGGHLGVVAQTGYGNEAVSGTLLGQAWAYTTDAGGPMAGLLGVSARHEFSERLRGNISADANVGSSGLVNIKGSARLSFDF